MIYRSKEVISQAQYLCDKVIFGPTPAGPWEANRGTQGRVYNGCLPLLSTNYRHWTVVESRAFP